MFEEQVFSQPFSYTFQMNGIQMYSNIKDRNQLEFVSKQ